MAEGGPGASGDVVAALRAVDGVADASITPDRRLGGAGTLHLSLVPGADEVAVATAVNRILREHFGLAVDTDHVAVVDETAPVRLSAVPDVEPDASPDPAPGVLHDPAPDAQVADASVADVTAPTDGDDPWLGYERAGYGLELDDEPTPLEQEVRAAVAAPLPATSTSSTAAPAPADDQPAPALPSPTPAAEPGPAAGVADPILEHSEPSGEPAARGPRLLIERMQLVAADLGVETEVTLGYGAEHWTGHAGGAATPGAVHRSVAAATLRAVEQCVGSQVRLELEHLATPALGGSRAVVVEVSLVTRRGTERLTGASAVREDARQAVVRATLDALNRRLESYLVSA